MSKQRPITKGMVLCAGLGTRLLPITRQIPKPLVPVLNVPNLLHTLAILKRANILDIVINLYHLPYPIENFLGDGKRWGMNIEYSKEAELLGTGGGVKKAAGFFGGESFIVVNCDFVTNLDLVPYIREHQKNEALATMLLYHSPAMQAHYAPVGVDAEKHLCSLPSFETSVPKRQGIFTGIHILGPETLKYLEAVPSGINQVLYPELMRQFPKRVYGEFVEGTYWHDTGTPDFLWYSTLELFKEKNMVRDLVMPWIEYVEKEPGIWLEKGVAIPSHVTVRSPVMIAKDCQWGDKAVVGPFSVVGKGSVLGAESATSYSILLDGADIVAGQTAKNCVVFERTVMPTKKPY